MLWVLDVSYVETGMYLGRLVGQRKIRKRPHVTGAHARPMMVDEVIDKGRFEKLEKQRKDYKMCILVLFLSLFFPLFFILGGLTHNESDLCIIYFLLHISLSPHVKKSSSAAFP